MVYSLLKASAPSHVSASRRFSEMRSRQVASRCCSGPWLPSVASTRRGSMSRTRRDLACLNHYHVYTYTYIYIVLCILFLLLVNI